MEEQRMPDAADELSGGAQQLILTLCKRVLGRVAGRSPSQKIRTVC